MHQVRHFQAIFFSKIKLVQLSNLKFTNKRRCLCSDNVDGCCAMFNNASNALESIYKDYFFSKLKASYPGGFDLINAYLRFNTFQNSDQSERQKTYFLITLNNIEESIDCLSTMKKLFEVKY